jgi:hypothetical protein
MQFERPNSVCSMSVLKRIDDRARPPSHRVFLGCDDGSLAVVDPSPKRNKDELLGSGYLSSDASLGLGKRAVEMNERGGVSPPAWG